MYKINIIFNNANRASIFLHVTQDINLYKKPMYFNIQIFHKYNNICNIVQK